MIEFSENFLRGIPNDSYINEENEIYFLRFTLFDENNKNKYSINWEDDDLALPFTLNQIKTNGEIHFKFGAARLNRNYIDELIKKKGPIISYDHENDPEQENPYHGNIIYLIESSQIRRHIAYLLAAECELIKNDINQNCP